MCCFPLGFSDLAVKVMRDGDGDGRCKEEGDKWVPCPPGVAAGTRLRNGKPLGQTIADIASAPAKPKINPFAELMQSRRISPEEMEAVSNGIDFDTWRYDVAENLPRPFAVPNASVAEHRQALRAEFARVRQIAFAERRREIAKEMPDLFDEKGQIKKEKIKDYLDARRQRAADFVERVNAAKMRVSDKSRTAAQSIDFQPFVSGDVANLRLLSQEEEDEAVRVFDRLNPRPQREDYDSAGEHAAAVRAWQFDRDDSRGRAALSKSNAVRRALQNNLIDALGHEFTGKSGKRFRVDRIQPMTTTSGVTVIEAVVNHIDENGNVLAQAGYYQRTLMPDKKEIKHDLFRVKPEFQGEGIATTVNAMNEAIYKDMGFEKITLYGVSNRSRNPAESYSGASHWAANGFNWLNSDDKDAFLDAVSKAVEEGGSELFSTPQQRAILRELLNAAAQQDIDDPDALTAADFTGWPGFTDWFKERAVQIYFQRQI